MVSFAAPLAPLPCCRARRPGAAEGFQRAASFFFPATMPRGSRHHATAALGLDDVDACLGVAGVAAELGDRPRLRKLLLASHLLLTFLVMDGVVAPMARRHRHPPARSRPRDSRRDQLVLMEKKRRQRGSGDTAASGAPAIGTGLVALRRGRGMASARGNRDGGEALLPPPSARGLITQPLNTGLSCAPHREECAAAVLLGALKHIST